MALNQSRFKSRKLLRKEARKAKKQKRHEYYARRGKSKVGSTEENTNNSDSSKKITPKKGKSFRPNSIHEEQEYERKKERDKKKILDEEIKKKRIERMMKDNEEEEIEIKKLEKQLKFRKGKRSSAFALDGLEYLLDICDKKFTNHEAERTFEESDVEFENDLATVTGKKKKKPVPDVERDDNFGDDSLFSDEITSYSESDDENHKDVNVSSGNLKSKCMSDDKFCNSKLTKKMKNQPKDTKRKAKNNEVTESDFSGKSDTDDSESNERDNYMEGGNFNYNSDLEVGEDDFSSYRDNYDLESDDEVKEPTKKKLKLSKHQQKEKVQEVKLLKQGKNEKLIKKKKKKKSKEQKQKIHNDDDANDKDVCDENISADDCEEYSEMDKDNNTEMELWEDIYGRTRDKDGNIVQTYKPPQMRNTQTSKSDNKGQEQRLQRQLKGLLNRLAENNMASISAQIEELYMSHSRNDMNEAMKDLIYEATVSEVLTPERLIAEHAMLISILHANIGSEIGAYFLQFAVTKFDAILKEGVIPVEDKRINNLLLFIMYLFNFQIFHSKLMYDIINELLKNLEEKQIELLLLILRTVGLSLRKDDPLALKTVVLKIQERSSILGNNDENYSRMKYMLEVVSAVKNNNVAKIPNYNPELIEHLKKCMKVLIRKGNYKTELNISLQDLLNAEEHGRWWVVGSAWSGSGPSDSNKKNSEAKEPLVISSSFSQKLLDLAKKQRMNTDVRRTIFCTLMSAEDYLDAFEKLLKLGLKGAVEREIINVLLHCSLQEKDFNPYYFHLANKFCLFDRKYQMMIQYAVWDKIKDLNNMVKIQVTNLAKFLGNIIVAKGLPLSVLKVIQFSELDKAAVKLIRQVLLTILLTDEETVANVFSRIVNSSKLKVFRDGIRLFLHHFLLKNIKNNPDENSDHLTKMIDVADRVLTSSDLRMLF